MKKSSTEDITDFFQVQNKLSSKKKRQINKNKRKTRIEEISPREASISSLNSFDKKELLVHILVIKKSLPKTQDIDIAMISANAYCANCHLKKAQVFAI